MRLPMLACLSVAFSLAACAATPTAGDAAGADVRLSGPATQVVNDCFFDAVCTVTVQGTQVTTMTGRRAGPPPVWGHSDGQPEVGQPVEVLCRRTGAASCTLEGDARYYLRHLPRP